MRNARILIFIALAVGAAGCARPLVVKEVATVAEPLLVSVRSSTVVLQEQFTAQRKDLALSRSHYEGMRREPARVVSLMETIWQDSGRDTEREQLTEARRLDAATRSDPYAVLATAPEIAVAPAKAADLAGLIAAARALELMKQDPRTSFSDIAEFAGSVGEELKKLEDEAKK